MIKKLLIAGALALYIGFASTASAVLIIVGDDGGGPDPCVAFAADREVAGYTLLTWMDFEDTATLYTDEAGTTNVSSEFDPVRRIEDKGAVGSVWTQDTAGVTWEQPVGGKGFMAHQDGTSREFTGSETWGGATFDGSTLFYVGGTDGPIDTRVYIGMVNSAFSNWSNRGFMDSSVSLDYDFTDDGTIGEVLRAPSTYGELYVFSMVQDLTDLTGELYQNGQLAQADVTTGTGTVYEHNQQDPAFFGMGGRNSFVKEVLIYGGVMAPADREFVETCLGSGHDVAITH